MACPLTIVARRYSDSQLPNFDIYLPIWLARYNKHIYGVLLALILSGLVGVGGVMDPVPLRECVTWYLNKDPDPIHRC